jgi:hypothetical protein
MAPDQDQLSRQLLIIQGKRQLPDDTNGSTALCQVRHSQLIVFTHSLCPGDAIPRLGIDVNLYECLHPPHRLRKTAPVV